MANRLKKVIGKGLLKGAVNFYAAHSSAINTTGVIGLNLAALGFTIKNSNKITDILVGYRMDLQMLDPEGEGFKEAKHALIIATLKALAPQIAPIALCEVGSIIFAIQEHKRFKENEKTIATLTASLGVAQTALESYKDFKSEAVKELGEEKVKEIEKTSRTEEMKARIDEDHVFLKPGDCYVQDPLTLKVFSYNKEKLNLLADAINKALETDNKACIQDYWYDKIGLEAPAYMKNYYFMKDGYYDQFRIGVDAIDLGDAPAYLVNFKVYMCNDTIDSDPIRII